MAKKFFAYNPNSDIQSKRDIAIIQVRTLKKSNSQNEGSLAWSMSIRNTT